MSNYQTTRTPTDILTISNAIEFVFSKKFMDLQTMTIAKVVSVDDTNKVLSVKSLINYKLADGSGQEPPTLFDVPFGIIQGGKSAFIVHYAVGDIVLVGFISRSIDELKTNISTANRTQQVNTQQIRSHNIMDAFVIMSWGAGTTPTTYIDLSDTSGINITSNHDININSTGNVNINSSGNTNINATGNAVVNASKVLLGGATGNIPTQGVITGSPQTGQGNSTKLFVGS